MHSALLFQSHIPSSPGKQTDNSSYSYFAMQSTAQKDTLWHPSQLSYDMTVKPGQGLALNSEHKGSRLIIGLIACEAG